jgi:CRP/FNR family cyclic AMP-dependent transcriptional regulator
MQKYEERKPVMGQATTLEPILKQHPFLKDLPQPFMDLLVGCARNEQFEPGQYIAKTGDCADKFFIIREGRVAIEVQPPGRGAIIVETLADGDVLGWSWMFEPHQWILDARPLEPVRVISLDGACLRKKMEDDHDFGYEMFKRFAKLMLARIKALRKQVIESVG